jgi:hypothetical protein
VGVGDGVVPAPGEGEDPRADREPVQAATTAITVMPKLAADMRRRERVTVSALLRVGDLGFEFADCVDDAM